MPDLSPKVFVNGVEVTPVPKIKNDEATKKSITKQVEDAPALQPPPPPP